MAINTGSMPKTKQGPSKSKPTSRTIKGSNKNSGAGYSEDDGGSVTKAVKKPAKKK